MPKWMQMIYMHFLTGSIGWNGYTSVSEFIDTYDKVQQFIDQYKVSASVTGDPLAQKKPRRDKRVV